MMKRCPSTSASINRPETRMKYHTTPCRVIVGVAADGAGTTTLAPAVLAAPARAPAPRLTIRLEDMGILLWEDLARRAVPRHVRRGRCSPCSRRVSLGGERAAPQTLDREERLDAHRADFHARRDVAAAVDTVGPRDCLQ